MEIELKFQLPASKKKSVLSLLNKQGAQKIRLQAKYFDTPDRLLAKHYVAIRLRQEGEHWVQTFKAASKNHLQRIEEDIYLGKCESEPSLDLSHYKNNQTVQNVLREIFGDTPPTLELQFETDVQRKFHVFEFGHSHIEVCLDEGEIRTATDTAKLCEVEFELKQGSAQDLILFAQTWVEKYQLWLDVRSKAERGNLLALGQHALPAVKAKSLNLQADVSAEKAIQLIIENTLNHMLPNAAAIAADVAEAEHIHQAALAAIFSALGQSRDNDAIQDSVLPLIQQVGDFDFPLPVQIDTDISQLFRHSKTTQLFLALLHFTYNEHDESEQQAKFFHKSFY